MDYPPDKEGENVFDGVTGRAESATDYVSPTTDMDLDPLAEDHCPPPGRPPTNLSKKTPPTISGKSAENAKTTPRKKKAAKNQQPPP